ncbi:MAG: carboxypeptidase regulatory-like domain-containing protein [Sandaracinaceae bacterium]|nr:carboxypeptidase regulatory-like domain-containing protein [Sandaracinaceae bacterium]
MTTTCASCGGPTPNDVPDASVMECTRTFTFEAGDSEGAPSPLSAAAGQVRAGRLATEELPANENGLGTVAAGDFVLANNRIAVIIEDVGDSDIYDPWGGKIVGLAKVREGALVEPADFGEAMIGLGRFTLRTTSVSVLNDGTNGEPAVVRASGLMTAVPVIDEFTRPLLPGNYADIPAAFDYTLDADSESVDIDVHFGYDGTTPLRVNTVLHAFIQGNRMPRYAPNVGFEIGPDAIPYIGFTNENGSGYAWSIPDAPIVPFFTESGFSGYTAPPLTLAACAQTDVHMVHVVVGGPGVDGLRQAVARDSNETLQTVSGVVRDANGAPAAGVHVHALVDENHYIGRVTSDADGAFSLHLPSELSAVKLLAFRRGDAVLGPVDFNDLSASLDLTLAPAGTLRITISDAADMSALPARVQVVADTGNPDLADIYGEERFGNDRLFMEYPTGGSLDLHVAAGGYRVVVSHGYEYEILDTHVNVTADAVTTVDAQLEHVVDTTGILCGDFHIHTHRSTDSSDDVHVKVAGAVGDGVELLVRSDHEWIGDFQPIIDEMSLSPWAMGISSEEFTTTVWGHFGVFPLIADPTRANGGAEPWAYMLPPAAFARIRARPERPALIINHPRSTGGLGNGFAYFEAAGYDPDTGLADRSDLWDETFNLVEVFNESSFEENRNRTVRDWFSFLSHGRHVFAVGSSDSHTIATTPVGYPRTCLSLGTDDPRAVTPNIVRDTLEAGHSVVSGGIYVTATASGRSSGETVTGAGSMTSVDVVVQAASWVDVQTLEVIVDGVTTQTIALSPDMADPSNPAVRFRGSFDINVSNGATGSYVVFVAAGAESLQPVHPGRMPFGVTNPIFFTR